MVTSIGQANRLAEEYNKLKNDKARLVYISAHPKEMMLQLDNDSSHVSFIATDEDFESGINDVELNPLDEDFGDRGGVYILFELLGIRAESV